MSKKGDVLFAFLTGAAVGAVIGVLYAPDKGKNTRDKLSFQLTKYREKLKEMIEKYTEGKEEYITMAKSEGEKVVKDARNQAEALLSDVEELIGQIKGGKSS
jgi:gas vesicle protein